MISKEQRMLECVTFTLFVILATIIGIILVCKGIV